MSTFRARLDRWISHRAARFARRLAWVPAFDRVLFLAEGGASCGLSLLAASDLLHQARPRTRQVWACQDGVSAPAWATRVRVGSGRHRWLAARSRWWLTDGITMRVTDPETSGIALARGPRTAVVGVVDPSLERVGSDVVDWPLLPASRRRLRHPVDAVLAPSEVARERSVSAWGFEAPVVLAPALAEIVTQRDRARRLLGLTPDQRLLAWHLSDSRRHGSFPLGAVAAGLPGWRVEAVQESAHPALLVAAADVVVADTGWPLVCAASAGHAVVVYAPDPRDGRSRGPGLVRDWPGRLPLAGDAPTLVSAVEARRDGPVAGDEEALRTFGALAADGDPRGAFLRGWDHLTRAGA